MPRGIRGVVRVEPLTAFNARTANGPKEKKRKETQIPDHPKMKRWIEEK